MKKTNVVLMIILAFVFSCNLAPGSYPYAEQYEVNIPEKDLISRIEEFKLQNPKYLVPAQTKLTDGRRDDEDYWHHVYFYDPDKNQIVNTWVRPKNNTTTTFAVVGINEGLTLGNWKQINKDFSSKENKRQLKLFEEEILYKIVRKDEISK